MIKRNRNYTVIPEFNIKQAAEYNFYDNSEHAHKLLYGLYELVEKDLITIDTIEDLKELYKKT